MGVSDVARRVVKRLLKRGPCTGLELRQAVSAEAPGVTGLTASVWTGVALGHYLKRGCVARDGSRYRWVPWWKRWL